MLTTTLKTKLSIQAERDIASVFHQLTLMAEWCSISLPDANARVTAGRVEKNLSILVRDIASRETNKTKSGKSSGLLKALGGVLGLLQQDPSKYRQGGSSSFEVVGSGGARGGGSADVESVWGDENATVPGS